MTVKKTTSKPVQVPVQEKTDDTLAIATLTGVLLQRGHTSHSAVEQAKKIVELIREPS